MLGVVGASVSCEQTPASDAKPELAPFTDVQVAPIQVRELQRGIDVSGSLFPDEQAQIAAKSSGRIVKVVKDLGDEVAPDEPLAYVDETDYRLVVEQREAAVAEALSRLGVEKLPEDERQFEDLPSVQRAAAQERNAVARFDRGRQLFESDPPLISQQEMADLETSLEVARHNVTSERLAVRTLISQARIRMTELAEAKQQLMDAVIRAPAAAEPGSTYSVAARLVSVGEFVARGQTAFELVDTNPVKFRADVPERFASRVSVGQRVSIKIDAFEQPFEGTLRRIAPRIDERSRTFVIEAEFSNDHGLLKPGAFAVGKVETHREQGVLMVPIEAVISFAGVKRVFSVHDGKAVEHQVDTGVVTEGQVEVTGSNLSADSVIVVSGGSKLVNGAPVRIVLAEAVPARDNGGEVSPRRVSTSSPLRQ